MQVKHCMYKCYFVIIGWLALTGLAHSNTRIVSLSPNVTHIVHQLIKMSPHNQTTPDLVGTICYSGQPDYYQHYTCVGRFNSISLKTILRLHPDLVLTWDKVISKKMIHQLKRLGIPVKIFKGDNIAQLGQTFAQIGQAIHLPSAGKKMQQAYQQAFKSITTSANKSQTKQQPNVFIQLTQKPMFTVGQTSLLNQMVQVCGGKNIFASTKMPSFMVSTATILKNNPDMIIQLTGNGNLQATRNSRWQQFSDQLKAVKQKQVYQGGGVIFSQPTPNLIQGIRQICHVMAKTA